MLLPVRKTKTTTKVLSIILALIMVMSCMPLAFAVEREPSQTPDCIKWDISFDKEKYGLFDTAIATIKLTNTSKDLLLNVKTQVSADGLKCSRSTNELGVIPGGATRYFTARFELSPDASGLNFFAMILLRIHELFNTLTGRSSVQNTDSASGSLQEASVDFGWGGKRNIKFSADYAVFENRPDAIDEAVEAYNKAAAATTEFAGVGYVTLESVYMEPLRNYLDILRNSLSNTVFDETELPGEPPLTANDVVAASLNSNNGKTEIVLVLKDQEDDITGKHRNGDSVSRGIGTVGDFINAIGDVGVFNVDVDKTTVLYTCPVISVTVDDATGKIFSGNWSYLITMTIDEAELKIGRRTMDFSDIEIVMGYIIVM